MTEMEILLKKKWEILWLEEESTVKESTVTVHFAVHAKG